MLQRTGQIGVDIKRKRTDQYRLSCMSINKSEGKDAHELPTYVPATYSDRVPLHLEWKLRKEEEEEGKLMAMRAEIIARRKSTITHGPNEGGGNSSSPSSAYKPRSSSALAGVGGEISGALPAVGLSAAGRRSVQGTYGLGTSATAGGPLSNASFGSSSATSGGDLNGSGGGGSGGFAAARRSTIGASKHMNWLKRRPTNQQEILEKKQSLSLEAQLASVEVPKPTLKELMEEQKSMQNEAEVIEVSRQTFENQYIRVLDQTEDLAGGTMDGMLSEARRLTQEGLFVEEEVEISTDEEEEISRGIHRSRGNKRTSKKNSAKNRKTTAQLLAEQKAMMEKSLAAEKQQEQLGGEGSQLSLSAGGGDNNNNSMLTSDFNPLGLPGGHPPLKSTNFGSTGEETGSSSGAPLPPPVGISPSSISIPVRQAVGGQKKQPNPTTSSIPDEKESSTVDKQQQQLANSTSSASLLNYSSINDVPLVSFGSPLGFDSPVMASKGTTTTTRAKLMNNKRTSFADFAATSDAGNNNNNSEMIGAPPPAPGSRGQKSVKRRLPSLVPGGGEGATVGAQSTTSSGTGILSPTSINSAGGHRTLGPGASRADLMQMDLHDEADEAEELKRLEEEEAARRRRPTKIVRKLRPSFQQQQKNNSRGLDFAELMQKQNSSHSVSRNIE